MRRIAVAVSVAVAVALASSAYARQDGMKQDPPKDPAPSGQDPKPADPKPEDPKPQDPPTTVDPATVKQDTAKITGIVETWYKILQEKAENRVDQIGYAHERISKAGPTKYAYFFEADMDYTPPGESGIEVEHVSLQVTFVLEDDFDPVDGRLNYSYGAKSLTVEVRTSPDRRFLEFKTSEGGSAAMELDPTETFLLFDGITIFRMRQRGELAKAGEVKTSIPAGDGGEFGSVLGVVSKGEVREYLGKKDTFVNPLSLRSEFLDAGSDYVVDRYGRVVERKGLLIAGITSDDVLKGIRMLVASDSKDAKGETTGLSARGRRDPFYKLGVLTPVAKKKTPTGKGVQRDPDEPKIVQQEDAPKEIERLAGLIKDMRGQMAAGNEDLAGKTYQKFLRGYKNLRDLVLGNPQQLAQLDALKFDAEKIYGGADKLLGQADAMLQAIQAYLDALDRESIEKRIKDMEKFRERLEFFNEDERRAKLEEKIRAAGKKRDQCLARIELEMKKIELTGVVISSEVVRERLRLDLTVAGAHVAIDEPVRFTRSVAYAVINNEYYREGDTVKTEGVRVDKINRQSIEVSYKDEVREVNLKKK